MTKRYCICYDSLACKGGAEQVTLVMQDLLSNAGSSAELCVDYVNPEAFEDVQNLVSLGGKNRGRIFNVLCGMHNFTRKTGFLKNSYDAVIYSGMNAPCAVHNQKQGRAILYCHTIPRFAYDLNDYYRSSLPFWQQPVFDAFCAFVRFVYARALRKMHVVVANSENVRRRIARYLNIDSVVVYPPVAVEKYSWLGQGDYYLSTSRLEDYKRVEAVVRAFMNMPDKKLIVASGGSQLEMLKALAAEASNITFTGWVDEARLRELVGNCIATVYVPRDEDFGMSPVESMAAGKPVIGVAEGGLLETVVHEQTGILVAPLSGITSSSSSSSSSSAAASLADSIQNGLATGVEDNSSRDVNSHSALQFQNEEPSERKGDSEGVIAALEKAVQWLTPERAMLMKEHCVKRAQQFSTARFEEQLLDVINDSTRGAAR